MPFRENADFMVNFSQETRHGGFAGSGIPGKHQVQRHRSYLHAFLLAYPSHFNEIDHPGDVFLHPRESNQTAETVYQVAESWEFLLGRRSTEGLEVVSSLSVILFGGLPIPVGRFHFVLRHALAAFVAEAQGILGISVILLGGPAIPLRRLDLILGHTLAVLVIDAQIVLSCGVILLGGLAIPLRRLDLILGHTLAVLVIDAQIVLSCGVILLGGFAIPVRRFHLILRHALAIGVADAQDVLGIRSILGAVPAMDRRRQR